ncbi:hypothetical protein ACLE20_04525 [Rhizobium sp. YIM 134829]|uniref:AbrB/MazE/SpoVT family DNA-binding domain-containing protein n=1 Tax=Rhizobium sp. YIM 134829 TaxID=3390453 RepID=UPI003978666E
MDDVATLLTVDGELTLPLSPALLAELGWQIGDVVTVDAIDGRMVVAPLTDPAEASVSA